MSSVGVYARRCRTCETAFIFFTTRTVVEIELCPVCLDLEAEIKRAREAEGSDDAA